MLVVGLANTELLLRIFIHTKVLLSRERSTRNFTAVVEVVLEIFHRRKKTLKNKKNFREKLYYSVTVFW